MCSFLSTDFWLKFWNVLHVSRTERRGSSLIQEVLIGTLCFRWRHLLVSLHNPALSTSLIDDTDISTRSGRTHTVLQSPSWVCVSTGINIFIVSWIPTASCSILYDRSQFLTSRVIHVERIGWATVVCNYTFCIEKLAGLRNTTIKSGPSITVIIVDNLKYCYGKICLNWNDITWQQHQFSISSG
jgi:hypothetical protein